MKEGRNGIWWYLWVWVLGAFAAYLVQFASLVDPILKALKLP